jgi:hypothetical protein
VRKCLGSILRSEKEALISKLYQELVKNERLHFGDRLCHRSAEARRFFEERKIPEIVQPLKKLLSQETTINEEVIKSAFAILAKQGIYGNCEAVGVLLNHFGKEDSAAYQLSEVYRQTRKPVIKKLVCQGVIDLYLSGLKGDSLPRFDYSELNALETLMGEEAVRKAFFKGLKYLATRRALGHACFAGCVCRIKKFAAYDRQSKAKAIETLKFMSSALDQRLKEVPLKCNREYHIMHEQIKKLLELVNKELIQLA